MTGVVGVVGFFGGLVGFAFLGVTGVGLVVVFPGLVVWMGIALVGTTYGTVVLGAVLGDGVDLGSQWYALLSVRRRSRRPASCPSSGAY